MSAVSNNSPLDEVKLILTGMSDEDLRSVINAARFQLVFGNIKTHLQNL